ncbi:MAG: GspMb/PilO family protein [Betaproteobacteria bacterium]
MKAWPSVLAVLAVALFHLVVLQPLEQRRADLQVQLARAPQPAATPAGIDRFHRAMTRQETPADWLVGIHAIGAATGVALQSARYREHPAAGRLQRYEMVLPVSGSYAQIREFVQRALAEIPVLSIDELSLRRVAPAGGRVHAELRMTLHRVQR